MHTKVTLLSLEELFCGILNIYFSLKNHSDFELSAVSQL